MPDFADIARNRTSEVAKIPETGRRSADPFPYGGWWGEGGGFPRHRSGDLEAVGKLINPGRPANIQLAQQLFRCHRLELTSGCRNRPTNARIPFGLR